MDKKYCRKSTKYFKYINGVKCVKSQTTNLHPYNKVQHHYKRDVLNKRDSRKERRKIKLHSGKYKQNLSQDTVMLISPKL